MGILPKGIWNGVDGQNFLQSKYNLEAIGSGPYAIKEIKKLPSGKVEQINLQANDDFYDGRPLIDEIDIKFYDNETDLPNAFHSREISGFGFSPLTSSLALENNLPQTQTLKIPLPQFQVVFFNLQTPSLSDQNVRQALNLATDRGQIISQIFKGQALLPVSPFVFNIPASRQALPADTDIQKAQSLLDACGMEYWTPKPDSALKKDRL